MGLIFFIAVVISVVFMSACYLFYLYTKSSSIIDVGWVLSISVIHLFYFFYFQTFYILSVGYIIALGFWSLRQAYSISSRLLKLKKDTRYINIETRWKTHIKIKYFFLYVFEGIVSCVLTLPFLFLNKTQAPLTIFNILILTLVLGSILGEYVADMQKKKHSLRQEKQNAICDKGLWYYSRHPNYFFQFLIWVFSFLLSLNSIDSLIAIFSPLTIFIMLYYISGIPPSEASSIISRGDNYIKYQKVTSKFLPWKKRKL